MPNVTITIDMDKLCAECGKGGATPNGCCFGCTTKAMDPERKMKSNAGKALQERWKTIAARGVTERRGDA